MKLSHLNALRALEATLRRGTFSAAADELGVTVAAIGQQLRGLEGYLGLKLFDRLPTGARPTAEARAVAERLTAGFGIIDETLAELRAERDGRQLSLSLTYHFLDFWLSPRLPRFYAAHPEIEMRVEPSDRLVDLMSENVDVAIRFSREPGRELDALDIYHGCYFPACSPEFAAAHGLTAETRDLTGVPLFKIYDRMTDPAWIDWPAWIDTYGMTCREPVPAGRTTGNGTAASGAGLVLTGITAAFTDLRDGRLVAPLGPRVVRRYSYMYRLVWPNTRRPSRVMRAFLDWITTERDEYLAIASALLGVEVN